MKTKVSHNPRQKQGFGYKLTLWKDGKPIDVLVHRLVASTFLEDLLNTKMTVNHKDGNRFNNNIENLEWLTLEDNIRYGFEHSQYDKCKKRVKLISSSGEEHVFKSYSEASRFLNMNKNYVSGCIKKGALFIRSEKGDYQISPF